VIILVFRYFIYLCSFRAAFGPFFQVFGLTFWSCSKILLFFHHEEHIGHGEIFAVHVTVLCVSWLKAGFFDRIEAERRKTDLGSPEGERSESIDRINKNEGSPRGGMLVCYRGVASWLHTSGVNSVSLDSLAPARLALRANLWLLHLKDPVFSIAFNLFRFFTSFVSFSVIQLSFSSF
jgi:hypothetical protein